MTTKEELARRWMRWRLENAASYDEPVWLAGMMDADGCICVDSSHSNARPLPWGEQRWYSPGRLTDWIVADLDTDLPDLDHPGTRAFLLEDVRRAHGITWAQVATLMTSGGVHGYRVTGTVADAGNTEAEALVAALEAAPE